MNRFIDRAARLPRRFACAIAKLSQSGCASALTVLMLAADWYICNLRYIFEQRAQELARIRAADGREIIHMPGSFGREVFVTLAPREADRKPCLCHH